LALLTRSRLRRTKAAIAERQKFSALLKMLRAGLIRTFEMLGGAPFHSMTAAI
jgi:vacuolar-type H+-ATPase subunit D/Vma8